MTERLRMSLLRILVIAATLALAEIVIRLFADPLFFSPPSAVFVAMFELARRPDIQHAFGVTSSEIAVAFVMSIIVGLPISLGIGFSNLARGTILPVVILLYAIPQVAILPLVVLIFGIGPNSKIVYGFTHGVFPMIIAIAGGTRNVRPLFVTAARSMGASRLQTFRYVIFPAIVPTIFVASRLAMASVLLGVLVAELYGSQFGVGHFTQVFAESNQPQNLFAVIAMLALVAIAINEALRAIERRAAPPQ
jgi:ABC-type nitrate/sulfonate/bicarbonate transport system permease component